MLVDYFLNSHHLSAGQCIKIVRRIYILITPGSQRVNTSQLHTRADLILSFADDKNLKQ